MTYIPTQAEMVCIGEILMDHRIATTAAQILRPEHFGDQSCREAYDAILSVWRDGKGVDLLTVGHEIAKRHRPHDPGRYTFLTTCIGMVASTVHFGYHAEIVREHYASRVLREAADGIIRGTASGEDPLSIIAPATEALSRAAMAEDVEDVNAGERAFDLMNASTRPKPIYLGMGRLDDLVWMLPGNVVTIRAEAGVGKTAFVLSAIMNLLPVVKPWFVSLEMPADELIMRMLCQLAQVDIDQALLGRIEPDERERMARVASTHADILSRLEIDDSGSMTTDELMAKAEHKVKNGCGIIVVDYAQLMSADKRLYPNQVSELEAVSKCIRGTARKLNVPILCIVHVNKAGEDHGTSQFEKDAHGRLHLTRERGSDSMGVEVLKNRNGRPGSVDVPCVMRWGMVGRTMPPAWCDVQVRSSPKEVPQFAPVDEDAPF